MFISRATKYLHNCGGIIDPYSSRADVRDTSCVGLFFYSEPHFICVGLVFFSFTNLIVILKLNFEKAVDTIQHEIILEIMKHMYGFQPNGCNWHIAFSCFTTAPTSVLLNRVSGNSKV